MPGGVCPPRRRGVAWDSVGGAPPPLLPDPVLPLGDKQGGGLCSLDWPLVLLSLSVWLSVTALGRCGHGVGLLSVCGLQIAPVWHDM
jgi:hypothetical protein